MSSTSSPLLTRRSGTHPRARTISSGSTGALHDAAEPDVEKAVTPTATALPLGTHTGGLQSFNASAIAAGASVKAGDDEGNAAKRPRTPLPTRQMVALFVLLFADAAVSTAPFPFLPFMARDLGATVEETGRYVGVVAGGRFAGNFLGSFAWGMAADRWGRRPCILVSLVFQCASTLLFAASTSHSIWLAAAARTLGGALNGAVPVSKTYIAEITDSTNQGLAMTIITACWGAGLVIGPALGGYLSSPADKYPSLDTTLFRAYPYALPMVVVAGICALAAVFGWLFLTETLVRRPTNASPATVGKGGAALASADAADSGFAPGSPSKNVRHHHPDGHPLAGSGGWSWISPAYVPAILHDPVRYTVVLLYAVLSIQAIGFDEMYSVFLSTPVDAGGVGYSTNDIGGTLVIFGACQILVTTPTYQLLVKRLGMVQLFQLFAAVATVCYFWVPLIPHAARAAGLPPDSKVTWSMLVVTVCMVRVANGICFTLQSVFTNNSVEQQHRGALNGLAMTVSAAVRAVTPLACGWVFGLSMSTSYPWPFDASLVFILIAAMMAHAAHIAGGLPRSIEKTLEEANS